MAARLLSTSACAASGTGSFSSSSAGVIKGRTALTFTTHTPANPANPDPVGPIITTSITRNTEVERTTTDIMPVLNLTLDLYQDMAAVIVYPSAFIVRHSEVDDAGVVHEWEAPMAGEALDAGGAVVLSWEDAQEDHAWDDGGNLVIHEFVHKIDMGSGGANGCPPFLAQFHQSILPAHWTTVFSAAYEDFCRRVDAFERHLPAGFDEEDDSHLERYAELAQALPMDPYGAEAPAEFFAVASEAFFTRPAPLGAAYPQVLELLEQYYRQKAILPG